MKTATLALVSTLYGLNSKDNMTSALYLIFVNFFFGILDYDFIDDIFNS